MFTFIQFALALVAIFALFAVVTNTKFRRRLTSLWFRKTDAVADSFGDVITDTKDAITRGNQQVESFENKVADLAAEVKIASVKHAGLVADANKWARIAQNAVEAGDTKNARIAVANKQRAEKEALAIKTQTDENINTLERLKAELAGRRDQIQAAEADIVVQEARYAGLKMRDEMLQASNAFGGSFGDLETAKEEINRFEAKLDAKDELRGSSNVELERLYSVNTDVDDELQKLITSVKGADTAKIGN
jgi:phage shock protein A